MGEILIMIIITGRIAAKQQTAGIKFTHRPKIRFFAPIQQTGTWVAIH